MICSFCRKDVDKAVRCSIAGTICLQCCFHISVASPECLSRIKKEFKLGKDDVLKKCSQCST